MSTHAKQKRLSTASIRAMKGRDRVVCLTAYTTPIARLLDPYCDLLLVGDSLGMVLYGMDTTASVSLDMMTAHGRAVMRGVERACVIVDLPFGSYQVSKECAFENALRLMQDTGCDGVKLKGGEEMAETVEFLVARGIPVFGHIGLMPQLVNTAGGFRSMEHSDAEAEKIRRDAAAIEQAGAFALVIEGTVESLAREITTSLFVPTIGVGASVACDGQVLVADDMFGLFDDFKFVKRFAELGLLVSSAVQGHALEVRDGPGARACKCV
ncbi:3-methyl-2-oxobutanoate hydroxymethyltransferase [Ensifer sp. SSB1]|uniref:3-methyl-2-oxobutanoate hydroxymethyltransferase n=1 Tax=Ensifer sp. SSB1 TaxID=2795385 RepID=UPI001A4FB319|nr:3-methyl-2-oxobutanoate hydroxymethyltransferase [Ensifer sp. SSB1]MBK5571539.1 3-methyl-2-oxobutanoate hydroxymethyltransferase [Ensifer sp. SSB1]